MTNAAHSARKRRGPSPRHQPPWSRDRTQSRSRKAQRQILPLRRALLAARPSMNHRSLHCVSRLLPRSDPRLRRSLQVPKTGHSVLYPTLVDLPIPIVIFSFARLDIAIVRSSGCLSARASFLPSLSALDHRSGNPSSPFVEPVARSPASLTIYGVLVHHR